MTPHQPPSPDEPFDRETFERELATIIDKARAAAVDIEGGYDVRTPRSEYPDYTVEITALTNSWSW